jgi:peroxiredoxin
MYDIIKGNIAPQFTLSAAPDKKLSLADFKGKRVVLAFYPADWSPVCSDQMALYNETLRLFSKFNAEIIGISVDSKWYHSAFSESRNLHFPLLADFEPKGAVSKLYGAYDETSGRVKEHSL